MKKIILLILMGLLITFEGRAEEKSDPLEKRPVTDCTECNADETCRPFLEGEDQATAKLYCVTAFRDPCGDHPVFEDCRVEYRIRVTVDDPEISLALPTEHSRDYSLFVASLTESAPQSLYLVREYPEDAPSLEPLLHRDSGIYSGSYMGPELGSKRLLLVRGDHEAVVLVAVVSRNHQW